jgi:uncharacterized protein (DUF2147 family)
MRSVYKFSISFFILLFAFTTASFAQSSNTIVGQWKSEEKIPKQLEIFLATDNYYYGKAPSGKLVFKKLKYTEKDKEYTGSMTPPDMNIIVNVTITQLSDKKLKVVAKKILMSKTIYLTKQ